MMLLMDLDSKYKEDYPRPLVLVTLLLRDLKLIPLVIPLAQVGFLVQQGVKTKKKLLPRLYCGEERIPKVMWLDAYKQTFLSVYD